MPQHVFDEMRHFFQVYKQLENKETSVDVVADHDEAVRIIEKSLENYKKKLFELTSF